MEALEGSFGVAMAVRVDWWVEYSDQGEPVVPSGAAVGTFSFADRQIFGIAPITEVLTSPQFFFLHSQCRRFGA